MWCSGRVSPSLRRYPGNVAARPVLTLDELFERMRHAPPPTEDDVTILWDGRRIDSKEAALQWLQELEEIRAQERASAGESAAG